MKNKKLFWGIMTILWVIVIFSFSLQPSDVSGDISGSVLHKILMIFVRVEELSEDKLELVHTILRKCAHFTEFAILGVLSSLTLSHTKVSHRLVAAMCFCVFVASMDEIIQLFVSGRAGRVLDVLIDSSGAFVGSGCVMVKKLKNK